MDENKLDLWRMRILVLMLQHTVKVLHKAYVPQGVLEAISPIYTTLSTKLHPNITQDPIVNSLMLSGYDVVITEQPDTLNHHLIRLLCQSCIQLFDTHAGDREVLSTCLGFMRCVCNYLDKTRTSHTELDDRKQINPSNKAGDSDDDSEGSTSSSDSDQGQTDKAGVDDNGDLMRDTDSPQNSHQFALDFITMSWVRLLQLLQNSSGTGKDGAESGQRSQSNELTNQQREIEQTIGHLVNACSTKQLTLWVNQLIHNCSLDKVEQAPHEVIVTLHLWTTLLQSVHREEHFQVLSMSSHCLPLHPLVSELPVSATHYCPLVVAVLNTQAAILTSHKVPAQCVSLTIQTCHQALCDDLGTEVFVSVFTAAHNVLSIVLSHYTQSALARLPLISMVIRRMLQTLVWCGRQPPEGVDDHSVTALAHCAHLMDRLLTQLCGHKTECGKIVVYLVADYTAALHKVTLLPAVKKNLLPAIHQCLNICDEHSIALLHTTLPHGFVEIFKALYEEYMKYHKYTGRV